MTEDPTTPSFVERVVNPKTMRAAVAVMFGIALYELRQGTKHGDELDLVGTHVGMVGDPLEAERWVNDPSITTRDLNGYLTIDFPAIHKVLKP